MKGPKGGLRLVLIGVAIMFMFTGCVGMTVKTDTNSVTMLQRSAVSTVGYLVAKNNPKYIPDLLKWYDGYQKLDEFVDLQTEYKEGVMKLSAMVSGDPFLQMQIRNAVSMLQITFEGPTVQEELGKYSEIVDYFMVGVMAVQ